MCHGRFSSLTPFRAMVPYALMIRAALNTFGSISTLAVPTSLFKLFRQSESRSRLSPSLGKSTRIRQWNPLPEVPPTYMLSVKPSSSSFPTMVLITSRASLRSSLVADTPDGLIGSTSMGNQQRRVMLLSLLFSDTNSRVFLGCRDRSASLTGLTVQYTLS